jgi:flagellar motor switch protein FliN
MADAVTARAFADGLVSEFGTAVESVLGTTVEVTTSTAGDGAGWIIRIAVSGDLRGTIAVWIGQADAATLAQRVVGMDEPPDEAIVIDMLREMWAQATSAVGMKDPFTGVKSATSTPEAGTPEPDALAGYELRIAEGPAVRLLIAGTVIAAHVAAPVTNQTPLSAPDAPSEINAKLEVVLDIDLPLVVRFGRTSMSLKALADLGPGSIVDMGRSPDAPVEMLVGDRVIARGEVVVVGGNYGVRIIDLVSSAERVRALEG